MDGPGLRKPPIGRTLFRAREVTGLRSLRDACSDRIQIHIDHAGRYRSLVQKRLRFEASFPKWPLIFTSMFPSRAIGSARHFINHETFDRRLRFSFIPETSLRIWFSSNSVCSPGGLVFLTALRKQIPPPWLPPHRTILPKWD